jgi:putative transposase
MTRPLRINFPGAWYHVMNRGVGRQRIFATTEHRCKFLEPIEEISSIYDIETHAYCLMDNHYHFLVRTPNGNLSQAIKHLNSVYSMYFNRSTERDGPLFRGRFKSIVVSGERYLLWLSWYIHRNPIQAKIIEMLPAYVWSSYPAYIAVSKKPTWLHTEILLQAHSETYPESSYQDFIEVFEDEDIKEYFDGTKLPAVIGDQEFLKFVEKQIASQKLTSEIVAHKYIYRQHIFFSDP